MEGKVNEIVIKRHCWHLELSVPWNVPFNIVRQISGFVKSGLAAHEAPAVDLQADDRRKTVLGVESSVSPKYGKSGPRMQRVLPYWR